MPAEMVQYAAQGKGPTGDNRHCDYQPSLGIPENLPGYLAHMQINEVSPSHSRNFIRRGFMAWDCVKSEDNTCELNEFMRWRSSGQRTMKGVRKTLTFVFSLGNRNTDIPGRREHWKVWTGQCTSSGGKKHGFGVDAQWLSIF